MVRRPAVCSRSLAPTPHLTSALFAPSRIAERTESKILFASNEGQLDFFSSPAEEEEDQGEEEEEEEEEALSCCCCCSCCCCPEPELAAALESAGSAVFAFCASVSRAYLRSRSARSKQSLVSTPALTRARLRSPTGTRSPAAARTRRAPRGDAPARAPPAPPIRLPRWVPTHARADADVARLPARASAEPTKDAAEICRRLYGAGGGRADGRRASQTRAPPGAVRALDAIAIMCMANLGAVEGSRARRAS